MVQEPPSTTRYEDVIARAVASLPHDASERLATYNRARDALMARLRAVHPPLPEVAIEAEQASLEAAIRRVEMEFGSADADAEELPPTPLHALDRRRHVRAAVLCGVGIALVLLAGVLAYVYRGSPGKPVEQAQRPATERASESASPQRTAEAPAAETAPAFIFKRQLVHYRSTSPAGTLVIDKSQRYLYVILPNVTAIRYGIALGGNCAEAAGRYVISRKLGEPGAPPAAATIGGAAGDRALYLDSEIRRIHSTDLSKSIGQTVRIGCFQLIQNDFAELYGRIPIGTRVVVN